MYQHLGRRVLTRLRRRRPVSPSVGDSACGPSSLHDRLNDHLHTIDDTTYRDLLFYEFCERYQSTVTSCGDSLFDHWTRIVRTPEEIAKIQADLRTLQTAPSRAGIEHALGRIGNQARGNIVADLWDGFQVQSRVLDYFPLLELGNVLIAGMLSIINPAWLTFSIMSFALGNLVMFLMTNRKIAEVSGSIHYLLQLCGGLRRIDRLQDAGLQQPLPEYRVFKRIQGYALLFKDGFGGAQSQDPLAILMDYLRIFLSLEIISYRRTAGFVLRHQQEVRGVILHIGYLDCLLNTLRIMEEHETVYSQITDRPVIDLSGMRHPLVEQPVAQSRRISRGMIVTGLNMAGKSTFMRSLGVNQVLATSFGIAFAETYTTGIFHIMTSFRIHDDLLRHQSRYYAEAQRLVSMKDRLKEVRALCLIDEILTGTNSQDRIYGSITILKDLASFPGTLTISATHDNQIAEELAGQYDLIYFDGDIIEDRIEFDYLIKDGIVSKRNGLLILRLLGIDQAPDTI